MSNGYTNFKIKDPEFVKEGTSTTVTCPSCFWRIFDKARFSFQMHAGAKRWIVITEKFTKPFEMTTINPDYIRSFDTEEEANDYVELAYVAEFERWLQ